MLKLIRQIILAGALCTLAGCAALSQWLAVSPLPVSSLSDAQRTALDNHSNLGQRDLRWPHQQSQRALVNNRTSFFSYQGQGSVLVALGNTTQFSLTINDQLVQVRPDASLGQYLELDISKLTQNGLNQLALTDIQPLGAQLRLVLPFPQLGRTTPEAADFSSDELDQLDAMIERDIQQGFPGAVLLIIKDGNIVKHSAYGYANRYAQDGSALVHTEPMQTDTVFDLASNSKMYATNYALMRLVSRGQLDVNAPVSQYLHEYQGEGRELRLVSDLLYHNAGYPPEVHFHRPDNRHGPTFYSTDRQLSMQLIATQVPFERERGGKAVYSDIDYMLLGLIIERITGMTQDQYLRETLYQPMGLRYTGFNPLRHGIRAEQIAATELDGNSRAGRVLFPADKRAVVRGEVHDEKARYAFDGVAGHAGLFSTAEETAKLALLALHGGYGLTRVFDDKVLQQFVRPSVFDHTVGLGWRTASGGDLNWHFGPYASQYAFGHTGWTGTATLIDPYYNLVVVLLTNKKHSPIFEQAGGYYFAGDKFETGMYGSIMSKIYQAMQ